jgi:uncharacterized protein (DUF2235 family)
MTEPAKTNKRLVFCFDGTWNRLSVDTPTNVVKLAQMVLPTAPDGAPQVVYYDEGIGTDSKLNRWTGGILGEGMLSIIREAYRFLIFNYTAGDEIYAFGFSRGAYTARSFIGFIRHAGILDAAYANQIDRAIDIYRRAPAGQVGSESREAIAFRFKNCTGICVSEEDQAGRVELYKAMSPAGREKYPRDPATLGLLNIKYLGVWDTVRALGIPDFLPGARWLNRKYAYHNAVLTSKVEAARHAVAIDEPRLAFRPTLFGADKVRELNALSGAGRSAPVPQWKLPYQELWFPGVHGAVGGGGARRGLSDIALAWVLRGARDAGLAVRVDGTGPIYSLMRVPLQELQNSATRSWYERGLVGWLARLLHRPRPGPRALEDLHLVTLQRWYANPGDLPDKRDYRPKPLASLKAQIDIWPYRPVWPPAPADGATWREHTVSGSDTLGTVAQLYLGNSTRWREIFDINRDRIEDPDDLANGQMLRVPPAADRTASPDP